ncbi:MAG: beta-galactosidase [Clostridia bacterium]|nr:beta-galactosidase [Clostridia bacterium]
MHINEKLTAFWHGADYNPDQWLEYPDVLKKDIELMKKSGCNVMSVGIFAWSMLEPKENVYNFEWLDNIIDSLYENGIYTVLATPSGAMPAWMAEKYPEVKRMSEDGIRERFGNRHNNCFSSPVYREKVRMINTKLAERYSKHPGVVLWHLSNEYNVEDCHCPLCKENFRNWLKNKYGTVENLNAKWWNGFWSHRYGKFSQIDPPGPHGEKSSNPLLLDWHRFKNDLLRDFVDNEIAAVRSVNPNIPVNTNFMRFWEIDYPKLADKLDVVSWDNYPDWHSNTNEFDATVETAMFHSLFNSMKKDRPFMMMESSPSATNWQSVSKLRRPRMHMLSSMQAVAHGSDTVQYFQWRKSRGQSEQFHGAVIGHDNTDDTRVFCDVAKVGEELRAISGITGSLTKNEVAILFDYDSAWSLRIAQAYRNTEYAKGFFRILQKNYGALWQLNIGCDFLFENDDFSKYKVIVAPMLFMLKKNIRDKIYSFVENGGTFISTFASGVVDEYGLSFFDAECYPFRKLLGVKAEETDSLYDGQSNSVKMFGRSYRSTRYCELAYLEGAEVLGEYEQDFYAGMPALTVNNFGNGKAYYIATDFDVDGYIAVYENLLSDIVSPDKIVKSPENVSVTFRYSKNDEYVFVMNFNNETKTLVLPFEYEVLSGEFDGGLLAPYATVVLKKLSK